MTAEERADLKIALEEIRGLRREMNEGFLAIPEQTRQLVDDAMCLHCAEHHARDAAVVSQVEELREAREQSEAFQEWIARHWRALVSIAAGCTAIIVLLDSLCII
jgi:hypothetical protein